MSFNPLDILFGQVANAVRDHASPNTPGPSYDSNSILGTLSSIFGQHAQQNNQSWGGGNANIQDASQDPQGDPADSGGSGSYANVRPASEDPQGDPADQR